MEGTVAVLFLIRLHCLDGKTFTFRPQLTVQPAYYQYSAECITVCWDYGATKFVICYRSFGKAVSFLFFEIGENRKQITNKGW